MRTTESFLLDDDRPNNAVATPAIALRLQVEETIEKIRNLG